MKQVYHSNASTNVRMRIEISKSNETNLKLSKKYGVSLHTIRKWRKRDNYKDKSSRPHTIHYSMSELDMLIAVELRSITWWSLDEITEVINAKEPEKIRSAVTELLFVRGLIKYLKKKKKKQRNLKNTTLVIYTLMLHICLK
jgi:transposase